MRRDSESTQAQRILYITGKHGHDWAKTSDFITNLLIAEGSFEVRITHSPEDDLREGKAGADYTDVIFLDYSGPRWSREAEEAFEKAVASGVGLVILHGSTVGFDGWSSYENMAGLLWREGTFHGDFGSFDVTIRDDSHPITHGIGNFTTTDELYCSLVPTPGSNHRILATGYSDPNRLDWQGRPGTGKDEPVMVVNEYGLGRVFYQVLGHVWPIDYGNGFIGNTTVSLETESFQTTLIRGCKWAARRLG